MGSPDNAAGLDRIAVVGMAGRFPGAGTVDQFWENLRNGVESIRPLSDEELASSGEDPARVKNPNYVRAGAVLDRIEWFDASFFGYSPGEAELIDPQQRLFLECAWEALEVAGYDPARYGKPIGVYAGVNANSYLMNNLYPNRNRIDVNGLQAIVSSEKDYLSTRVSYKLNLTGPSLVVQTACSTSLVAVHLACDALLNGQCDMALAGGACVNVPHLAGYVYTEGAIYSPDGHCRAFDADGLGTVFGSGVGLVVLKRLADALEDGDAIAAVIRGSAINNDGSAKIGYTAPSVVGQADVITEALEIAGVDPGTITYVEAHGTGTPLGDPIEVAALTRAFGGGLIRTGSCAIGSVKTNIGHLSAAAGVAGLIKTVLALKHRMIPPSLHFSKPNPKIDFESGPFYVNATLRDWRTDGVPRRAGVNSFGVGGTNAHVVLEEPPSAESSGPSRPWQLLLLSARTRGALDAATANLAEQLDQHADLNLADAAYTLKLGRKTMNCRRMVVCRDRADASSALRRLDPNRVFTSVHEPGTRSVVFMFTGQGSQYAGMAREVYQTERTFRQHVDRCSELLRPELGFDLRDVLFPRDERVDEATRQLTQTATTQPALFVIEYALARLLMEWGIQPQAMIGHSIGEYVAACLAGVFSLEDGLSLVASRGRLMNQLPAGSMLAVPLSEGEVQPFLDGELSLATINAPAASVVSGPTEGVLQLEKKLVEKGIACRLLHTSHAFHSRMMEPILGPFQDQVRKVELSAPKIPYLSNVTGTWIREDQATDPAYWALHLRQTVRFSEGVGELLKDPRRVLLEVGPGETLTSLVRRRPDRVSDQVALPSVRNPREQTPDVAFLLGTVGKVWLAGVEVDWAKFHGGERRHRVVLPTYPFERQRYWVEPDPGTSAGAGRKRSAEGPAKERGVDNWFYVPSWKQTMPPPCEERGPGESLIRILVFVDEGGLGAELAERLARQRYEVITVKAGDHFAATGERSYTIRPGQSDDYHLLLDTLAGSDKRPERIVHMWTVPRMQEDRSLLEGVDACQQRGFYSLLALAQALGRQNLETTLPLFVVSSNIHDVTGDEELEPAKATILGPCRTIPQEYENIACRCLDVDMPGNSPGHSARLADQLLAEIGSTTADPLTVYRGRHRWVRIFEQVKLAPVSERSRRLKDGGVYLITGGLGAIGLVLGEHLARTIRAKLVLVGRSALPPREQWEQWLAAHGGDDETSRRILKVQSLEQLGAEVLLLGADVANLAQMRDAIAVARQRFGTIDGVIHAAGIAGGGMIQLKNPDVAAQVLAPKLQGTLVLDEVLRDQPLDWVVLCSSVYSIVSRLGQVDYSAANSFLDAFAHYKSSRSGTRAISINWDGWQEVGMAAVAAASSRPGAIQSSAQGRAVGHPLVEKCLLDSADRSVYLTELSVATHWILSEHRVVGDAVVPGTACLEMARAAFQDHVGGGVVEISEAFFPARLVVGEAEQQRVYTILERDGDSHSFRVVTVTRPEDGGRPRWQEHATGRIRSLAQAQPARCEIEDIETRCTSAAAKREAVPPSGGRGTVVHWGPRWDSVSEVHVGEHELWGRLHLRDEFQADLGLFTLHPALLDVATSLACQSAPDGDYLPLSYERLIVSEALPARLFSHVTFGEDRAPGKPAISCDVVVASESGRVLVQIEGLTFRRVDRDDVSASAGRAERHPVRGDQAGVPEARARYFESFVPGWGPSRDEPAGISPTQGIDAFERILTSGTVPQVVVSTRDLTPVADGGGPLAPAFAAPPEPAAAGPSEHARPDIGTAYLAPRDESERALADIWQQALGLAQVGARDNFFELGGDSVIAIQIIARARKAGFRLETGHIFEHPTVAELAAVGGFSPGPAGQPELLRQEETPTRSAEGGSAVSSDESEFSWSEAERDAITQAIEKSLGGD
jgi:acyl transferase domain-containing protein